MSTATATEALATLNVAPKKRLKVTAAHLKDRYRLLFPHLGMVVSGNWILPRGAILLPPSFRTLDEAGHDWTHTTVRRDTSTWRALTVDNWDKWVDHDHVRERVTLTNVMIRPKPSAPNGAVICTAEGRFPFGLALDFADWIEDNELELTVGATTNGPLTVHRIEKNATSAIGVIAPISFDGLPSVALISASMSAASTTS